MPSKEESHGELLGSSARMIGERVCHLLLSAPSQRLAAEEALRQVSIQSREPEMKQHAAAHAACESAFKAAVAGAKAALESAKADASARLAKQLERIDKSEKAGRHSTDMERVELLELLKTKVDEQTWTADTMYETREGLPGQRYEELKKATEEAVAEVESLVARSVDLLERAKIDASPTETLTESPTSSSDPLQALREQGHIVTEANAKLQSELVTRLLRVPLAHATLFAVVVGGVGGGTWLMGVEGVWMAIAVAASALFVGGLQLAVWIAAGRRLKRTARPLLAARAASARIAAQAIAEGQARRVALDTEYLEQHKRERAAARQGAVPAAREAEGLYQRKTKAITDNASALRTNSDAQCRAAHETAEAICIDACAEAHNAREQAIAAERARHAARLAAIALVEATHLTKLRQEWQQAQRQVIEDSHVLVEVDHALFPRWSDPSWKEFRGRDRLTGAAKLGAVTINLRSINGALPAEPELAWSQGASRTIHVPVVLGLPRDASLLIEAPREGRPAGIAILQEAMLRLLAALPPGMARFTIADPVGLGEGFAAFMHLADDAEHLIGERIWTDPRHIEQRLADLCQHMETVIQKFLRNEFASLDEYNRTAGEIAEPYRFLVLCDFPANISDGAARHLASIINSGRRCGVFTLILRDMTMPIPVPLTAEEMRASALHLEWRDGHYHVAHEWMGQFPIAVAPPPTKEEAIALLKRIGKTARDSKRVEVPFAAIAPRDGALWRESAAENISVPLGRTGATRLQSIQLGVGTSQHALIAGKTGSGKSTLFHALITNLALRFSPDEAELWLIDFKKGVEFRTYATNALPHARVVAVESDREFGLSVLRGLDVELRRRGELFRQKGVQDLGGYRRLGAKEEVIPRSLLIIDEFQELFTEDDKVSEESGLLLDRLVRQGRAFGMHVVLGSQTLGGAYSIARATMGQMAVRIALQCNEADSQLILSDDNLAGRLLSRPGDAIYNDSGGLVEGNNPFQVVWLSDEERDRWLSLVREKQQATPPRRKPNMIVFEGNVPAQMDCNAPMQRALARRSDSAKKGPPLLWLGDAISIKDPTAMVLSRQTGANLMVVGQRDDAALAISAAAMVSLAAQCARGACRVLVLDGTPPDAPDHGRLAQLAAALPMDAVTGGHRDAERIIAEAAAELARRQQDHSTMGPTWLVLVHGIHRFRSLRRNEDDYSFSSSSDAPASADKVLALLLKEGPQLGIHVMVTCDGATNLGRAFDRNAIREFEYRALFQVSATDSSTLIDSPVASRLGPMRALLHSEETGMQEKFRPYAWPDEAWIARTFHSPPRSP